MTDTEEKLIKVHLPGERLWALDLGDGKAKLRNAPFAEGYSLFDIVKIDSDYNVTELIERTHRPVQIKYEFTPETIAEDYKKLVIYLSEKKIHIEGFVAGYAGLSVPNVILVDELKKILDESPVKLEYQFT